jgi:tRNA (cmo5U34)-methyltransferase
MTKVATPRLAFDFDGEYGRIYDALVQRVIPGYADAFFTMLGLLETRVAPDAHLLVVGSGTGMEIRTFAPRQPAWRFTAVDPASRMIDATMAAARAVGAATRLVPIVGTVDLLPEGPAYDAATVVNVLHFLPDDGAKKSLLQSVAQRLRRGAPLVLFDLHGDAQSADYQAARGAWRRFQAHRGLTPQELLDFNQRLDTGLHLVGIDRLEALWSDVGLTRELTFWGALLYGGWLLRAGPPLRS